MIACAELSRDGFFLARVSSSRGRSRPAIFLRASLDLVKRSLINRWANGLVSPTMGTEVVETRDQYSKEDAIRKNNKYNW